MSDDPLTDKWQRKALIKLLHGNDVSEEYFNTKFRSFVQEMPNKFLYKHKLLFQNS